jgi:hypothetical protein
MAENDKSAKKKGMKLNAAGLALGDGVDFAAAGASDLNNFKGYHNQAGAKEEAAQRYTDPISGAHFEFGDMSNRMIKIQQNREQEKKIYVLTGRKETLDQSFYQSYGPRQ